ncbi:hypothetical protein RN001_015887 [Aquatica leii]|uniref:Uncharacterized protein n=1 Tax=Aquatica leii TaxID=1421715 RepID=A0AAN7NZK1_9COLE|nr:hypothetical protein RN001_015887 [Aquatica leii]
MFKILTSIVCKNYKKTKCGERVITVEDQVTKNSDNHNHAADAAHVEATFVPTQYVVEAFEMLCDDDILPPELQPIVDYFEDTWIGRPQRRQRRREPRFSHTLWNCFDAAVEGLPKTKNSVEDWRQGFEQQISANHPNIWKFIEAV